MSNGRFLSRRPKVHVHRLIRTAKLLRGAEAGRLKRLEARNMKLYLMNKMIGDQNEQLRKKAMVLLQEKKNLLSQYHHNLLNPPPQFDSVQTFPNVFV